MSKRELLDMLPRFYDESPEVDAIMDTNAKMDEAFTENARDLLAQMHVETATWGLALWERVLELPPRPNSTDANRRARILARLAGTAPATVRYLTDVVNAHVTDKSARIVEVNGEYRFEAEINVDNSFNVASIIRDINEVKPAHLAFGVTGIIRAGIINVVSRAYDFDVNYRITNTFQTDSVKGGLAKAPFSLREKAYSFDVLYPIANTFVTSGISVENTRNNVILTEEYRTNDVLYKRVGVAVTGEGDI